jgi:hypothetical protein
MWISSPTRIVSIVDEPTRPGWRRYAVTLANYDEGTGQTWRRVENYIRDANTDTIYWIDDIGRSKKVQSPEGFNSVGFGPDWIRARVERIHGPEVQVVDNRFSDIPDEV